MLIKLLGNYLFEKGRDYIVKDNSVKIIDELTEEFLKEEDLGTGFIKL